jgi:segregation and condensation protein A
MSVFTITTEAFKGPIELLLDLIKERKLPINEISLAKITDDYLRIMSESQSRSYDEITQFMGIAATLILIKSKSLLPILELTDDEEENIADLEKRLKMYDLYKEIGQEISLSYNQSPMFGRSFTPFTSVFAPDKKLTLPILLSSMRDVLHEVEKFNQATLPEKRIRSVVHLEEMIDDLVLRIQKEIRVSFRDYTNYAGKARGSDPKEHVSYIVVGFLAMLEMVRNGIIAVEQQGAYEDIMINKQ